MDAPRIGQLIKKLTTQKTQNIKKSSISSILSIIIIIIIIIIMIIITRVPSCKLHDDGSNQYEGPVQTYQRVIKKEIPFETPFQ